MANILFLDGTWSESATMVAWANQLGSAPASNLLHPQPSIAWDSFTTLPASQFFTSSFTMQGPDTGYDAIFMGYWELTPEAFFRVRTANTQAALSTAPVYTTGNLPFHKAGNLDPVYKRVNSWHIFPQRRFEPWVQLLVHDAFNPAGRLVGGVIRIGQIFRPQRNVSFGYGFAHVDPSEFTRTYGSTLHTSERPGYDELPLPFNFSTQSDAVNLYRLYRRFGKKHAFWVHLNSDETSTYSMMQIYGKMAMDEPIIRPDLNIYRLNIKIEEMP